MSSLDDQVNKIGETFNDAIAGDDPTFSEIVRNSSGLM